MQQLPVVALVLTRHSFSCEPLFEPRPDLASVYLIELVHRLNSFVFRFDDETRDTVLHHLGHRACPTGDNGRPAGHRFDHHETEWFGPVDRKEQRGGFRKKGLFGAFADLADELNILAVDRCE